MKRVQYLEIYMCIIEAANTSTYTLCVVGIGRRVYGQIGKMDIMSIMPVLV